MALRRRFAFFELMPDAELLEGTVINGLQLDALLETLNEKIAQIGGSGEANWTCLVYVRW